MTSKDSHNILETPIYHEQLAVMKITIVKHCQKNLKKIQDNKGIINYLLKQMENWTRKHRKTLKPNNFTGSI